MILFLKNLIKDELKFEFLYRCSKNSMVIIFNLSILWKKKHESAFA